MPIKSRDFEDGYDTALSEAAGSVEALDRKCREMERVFWAVVAASGGTVSVPHSLLARFNNPKWEIRRDDANDCVIYKVTV